MMNKIPFAFLLLLSFAACGGSSASIANVDRIVVGNAISDAALANRITTLSGRYFEDFEKDEFAASVPMSGNAKMRGAVVIGATSVHTRTNLDQATVLGQLDVSVDFATNDINGIASGFRDNLGGDMVGQLILDARILRDGDAGISGTLAGNLENSEVGPSDLAFNVQGNFMGPNAGGLFAGGTGTVKFGNNNISELSVVFAAD